MGLGHTVPVQGLKETQGMGKIWLEVSNSTSYQTFCFLSQYTVTVTGKKNGVKTVKEIWIAVVGWNKIQYGFKALKNLVLGEKTTPTKNI